MRASRVVLYPVAILAAVFVMLVLQKADPMLGRNPVGWGVIAGVTLGLGVYGAVRPAPGAVALAWLAPALCVTSAPMMRASTVLPSPDGTVHELFLTYVANVQVAFETNTVASYFVIAALGAAAIASAREARRAAPELSVARVLAVVLLGVVVLYVAALRSQDYGVSIALALSLLAIAAASSARGEPAAVRAALLALVTVVIAVIFAALEHGGPREGRGYDLVAVRWPLLLPILVPLALAPLAVAPRALTGARALARPMAAIAIAMCAPLFAARAELSAPRGDEGPWPPIARELGVPDACEDVRVRSVARLDARSIAFPGEALPLADTAAIVSRLEARAQTSDLLLAIDAKDATFGPLGELLGALGRARGARAEMLSFQEPPEGCGVVLVGASDGAMTCSRPGPLGGACIPRAERVWVVALEGGRARVHWRALTNPKDVPLEQLATETREQWSANGEHRDPYDRVFDQAVLRAPATASMAEVMAAAAALASVRREIVVFNGSGRYGYLARRSEVPALTITFELAR